MKISGGKKCWACIIVVNKSEFWWPTSQCNYNIAYTEEVSEYANILTKSIKYKLLEPEYMHLKPMYVCNFHAKISSVMRRFCSKQRIIISDGSLFQYSNNTTCSYKCNNFRQSHKPQTQNKNNGKRQRNRQIHLSRALISLERTASSVIDSKWVQLRIKIHLFSLL
jgi:hypothetical protein